jgi:hypothetical protein
MKELISIRMRFFFKINNINGGWNLVKSNMDEWYFRLVTAVFIFPNIRISSKKLLKRYFKTKIYLPKIKKK